VAQAGNPFTVYTDSTSFNPGSGQSLGSSGDYLANGGDTSLPDVVSGTQTKGFTRGQLEYAPNKNGIFGPPSAPTSFTIPAGYGTVPVEGNEGPNIFHNPGYFSVDGNLNKAITLPWFRGENGRLNFSIECFNIFNRPNLGPVNSDLLAEGPLRGHAREDLTRHPRLSWLSPVVACSECRLLRVRNRGYGRGRRTMRSLSRGRRTIRRR
jgi:hypothetical protein